MHRAGVLCARCSWDGMGALLGGFGSVNVVSRVRGEPSDAFFAAEIVGVTLVLDGARGFRRVDVHSAYRIFHESAGRCGRVLMGMMFVVTHWYAQKERASSRTS